MSAISIGCWTCRVRHKKCDITLPICRECSDRNVQCHGYGPRPTWMDGGSEEKKEKSRIKTAINQHVRRLRKMRNRAKPAPAAGDETESTMNPAGSPAGSPLVSIESSTQDTIFDPQSACLLMHYLDQVFAWQFPYFCYTSRLGNRGWLLYLLMKRGPLYHAVLSLSSLHQSAILGSEEEFQQKEKALEHHSRALREFCKFMGEERGRLLDDNARLAEFLACSLIMISCGEHDWLLHLDAVIGVIHSLSPESIFTANSLSDSQSGMTRVHHQEGLEFLLATMVSLDLFACLPTGRVPQLPYQKWLQIPEIQISDLLSCENWVMMIIGDLACFGQWKKVQEEGNALDVSEMTRRGGEIKARLTTGIEELDLIRDVRIASPYSSTCTNLSLQKENYEPQTSWVTRMYALACLVLLHTTVSGPLPTLPEIRETVSRSIVELQGRPRAYSLTGLVWAICVVGCMAQADHQLLFEDLMADLVRHSARFGNLGTVLKTMRSCWKLQETESADCRTTMVKTGICAILI
ncbi:unnamed protein product [Penicillium olsonii]|uniref:Zn(2)-C6 fungal-type domain-containing protein n=1 Tax=Penicillium olsonii TaxID=99116 RepID=A0A9W4IAV2_PENOL|nr:unnamed protein product [Penicillium olsonii]CAG8253228.1 unnamed protein product [Penicillium olsonii]